MEAGMLTLELTRLVVLFVYSVLMGERILLNSSGVQSANSLIARVKVLFLLRFSSTMRAKFC
jgi:hypothetical protein